VTEAIGGVCFHCGERVPAGARYAALVDGRWEPVCCAGCEAVASAIAGQGLAGYYRLREAPAETPGQDSTDLTVYDDPAVQRGFVRGEGDGREALLLLEGMRCPACAWLAERSIAARPGVRGISVNYATRVATVRWDPARVLLSELLRAARDVGYRASPFDPARARSVGRAERRGALARICVAGLGSMQVMMYAVPAYLAGDGDMSADIAALMRWAGFALTVPVVAYSAWPFFAGAWRDLRVARLGMDVPVALGVAAAFGASALAMFRGAGEV
jgi:Cu2+-exporting ATPase